MDEYLTPKEAAALLKVDVQTIRRWIRAGKVRALKIQRRISILKSDLTGRG